MSADIGNIRVGQAPAGVVQTSPAPTSASTALPPPKPAPLSPIPPKIILPPTPVAASPLAPPIFVVPPTGSSDGGVLRKMLYGIVVLLFLGALAYAAFSLFGGDSIPQETVSPSVSPSTGVSPAPTLGIKNLRSYFPQAGPSVTLQMDDTARPDLLNTIATSNPASKQALRIGLTVPWPDTSAFGLLDAMTGVAPAALAQTFGADWVVLSYGQREQFDSNGLLLDNQTTTPRLLLVTEVTDASAAHQVMTTWESASLASSADILFSYDFSKAIVSGFQDGTYRQIGVRYWNFPYADRSIDYSIVTASNNKNYLILSGSRESAFFAIDQLMQ